MCMSKYSAVHSLFLLHLETQYRVYEKVDPFQTQISHHLLYSFDNSYCFELMLRKNTRSSTHGTKYLDEICLN